MLKVKLVTQVLSKSVAIALYIEESENDEVLGSVNRSIGDWQLDSRVILEKDTCMDQSWKNMTYK